MSNSVCRVPKNHSKYGTLRIRVFHGTPVELARDHRGTGVEAPASLLGKAFYLDLVGRHEGGHGRAGGLGGDPVETYPPVRCLQAIRQRPGPRLNDVEDVKTLG